MIPCVSLMKRAIMLCYVLYVVRRIQTNTKLAGKLDYVLKVSNARVCTLNVNS